MRKYFAFGSNMSRARLEERVGTVEHLGVATARGYAHDFSKRGGDGSGKGNIFPKSDEFVLGVCYQLTERQWDLLLPFEDGYRVIEIRAELHTGTTLDLYTLTAIAPDPTLRPTDSYIAHYQQGMRENGFPEEYVATILAQAAHRP